MKNKLVTLLFLINLHYIYCQTNYEDQKKTFFVHPNTTLDVIRNNWGMYFKEDVSTIIDPDSKKYIFEIKLDSYGSVYPEKEILDIITKSEFEGKVDKYANLESHSFYWRFVEDSETKIEKAVKNGSINPIYSELLELAKVNKKAKNADAFFEKWDKFHNDVLIRRLNDTIRKREITRVIFFIHGYNVPYSLAVLQAINMYKLGKSAGKIDEHTLFVPVYWPSNNAKECKLEQSNFSTKNIKTFKTNGKLFLRYSDRCYYSAITLRKIINDLDASVKVDMIAHSLGATIPTSCLINTSSKLHYNIFSFLKCHSKDSTWIVNTTRKFSRKDEINFDVLRNFYKVQIPSRPINVFLSAAAIPGVETFKDVDVSKIGNKCFYVSINPNDEMVTKREIRNTVKDLIHIDIASINANRLGYTTLGCDSGSDACATKKQYELKLGTKSCFKTKITSTETDHDIFTYMQQEGYKMLYYEFLEGK